jgi:rRNA maturation endonuclease Nob1
VDAEAIGLVAGSGEGGGRRPEEGLVVMVGTSDTDKRPTNLTWGEKGSFSTTLTADDYTITYTADSPTQKDESKEEKPKARSGRCRRCGNWVSDLDRHEKKECGGSFRRR